MIRIIKQGKKRVVQCSQCDCVFEYEKEDVIRCDQIGISEYKYRVVCPCCRHGIEVHPLN